MMLGLDLYLSYEDIIYRSCSVSRRGDTKGGIMHIHSYMPTR